MRDDVPALVRVIAAMDADVLCVQEAPRALWCGRRRRELAELTGTRVAAGCGLAGLAVYVKPTVKVVHAEAHLLRVFFPREVRGLATAVVELEGLRLAAGSIHLDLVPAHRLYHATEIVALLERVAARFAAIPVLAGDLNERDHEPTWRYLAARLADCYARAPLGDAPTFPARNPTARIDAVFAGAGLEVDSCGVVPAPRADLAAASDHLPVVARLRRAAVAPEP
ncbi:endonuclease/exonuclease/phosphatase family protein [Thermoactinospora rubra]|uniref:endonuclease/exonuclease/phosphatase family protein n=1 Tax=Thermoactinospora rubra TaxID=1088767 RepID=UPI000A110007|nr:endonuclease/exonuclease/phosphatase family protein [Thermoactinospora rubra]